jgi:hypothetical protein
MDMKALICVASIAISLVATTPICLFKTWLEWLLYFKYLVAVVQIF